MQTLAFVPSKVLNFIREDENTLSILHCLTKSRICPQYKTELANSGSRTLIRCQRLQVHRWLEMEGVSMDTNLHGRSQSFHSVHSRSCLRPARFVVCTHRCQPCSDAAFEEIDRSLLAARSSHGGWPDKQLAWSRALDHGDGGPAPAVGRAASAKQLGWSRNTHSQ